MTSNEGRGGRRYAPYAFAEQGVAGLDLLRMRLLDLNDELAEVAIRERDALQAQIGLGAN